MRHTQVYVNKKSFLLLNDATFALISHPERTFFAIVHTKSPGHSRNLSSIQAVSVINSYQIPGRYVEKKRIAHPRDLGTALVISNP